MYNINGFISSKIMDHLRNVYPYNLLDDLFGRGCARIDDLLRIDIMKVRDIMENQDVLTKDENMLLYLVYHDKKSVADITEMISAQVLIKAEGGIADIKGITESVESTIHRAKNKLEIHLELAWDSISIDGIKREFEKEIKDKDTEIEKLKFQLGMYQAWFKLNGVVDGVQAEIDIHDKQINAAVFGVHIFNALWRAGFHTFGDIAMSSIQDLKKVRCIGNKRRLIILKIMNSYGINIPEKRY